MTTSNRWNLAGVDTSSEDFGHRHFIVADPAGSLVDIITENAPAASFIANFESAAGTTFP